ncbi:polysaccharide deacetylase family protein [Paenibacillus sp. y28]|uniref:polysaccharide deacetylase family protein n=1 Tax=Paenibacillus sp. y28 TaxID=3129110 RepID=UPI003018968C
MNKSTATLVSLTLAMMLAAGCSAATGSPPDKPLQGASEGAAPSPGPTPQPTATAQSTPAATASPTPAPSPSSTPVPPPSPTPAATPAATKQPQTASALPENKALSWYYVKKGKGIVPTFPNETKSFPERYKAIWVGEGKKVYLTIDAGGDLGDTATLLEALKDNGVKANFFIAGYNMKANPDYIRQLVADGHLVANHTMTHGDFTQMSDEKIKKEITDFEALFKDITGQDVVKYFRFPYGKYTPHQLGLVSDMGYTSVFWSTAMRDWEPRKNGAEDPYNDIMNGLHDGNVILMHEGSKENIEALDRIVREVKKAGYEFGLVSDLKSNTEK